MKINKKWLVVGLVMGFFLLIGIIVAQSSKELTKTYDSNSQIITIKNNTLNVAKITLNTPTIYNVFRGKNRLVAEFTIENYYSQKDIFNGMDFYDLKKNNKEVNRNYTYKVKSVSSKLVFDYNKQCSNDENSSLICRGVINGTKKQEVITWNNLDKKDLSKGNITLGVFTDVYAGDYIEWIPTLYGIKINEFAIWNDTYSVNLTGYWGLNEGTGITTAEQVNGLYNGTITGATWNSSCINFNCTYFDAIGIPASNYVNISAPKSAYNLSIYQPFTINFWINNTAKPDDFVYLGKMNALTGYMASRNSEQKVSFVLSNTWGGNAMGRRADVIPSDNLLNMVTITYDGTGLIDGMKIYINGTETTSYTDIFDTLTDEINSDSNLMFGWQENYQSLNRTLDEVSIWENRNLTAYEVSELWNSGAGIFYIENDKSIIINITYPINNTNWTLNNINVNYTETDLNVESCWYSNDSGINNISLADCGTNITGVTWIQGKNNVTIWVNDTYGNQNHSDIAFFIDSVNPDIVINSPPVTTASSLIIVNITPTDVNNISYCDYNLTRGASTEKATASLNLANFTESYTLSGTGTYMLWLYCNDSFGNKNYTNMSFTYSLGGGGGGGGGAGITIQNIISNITEIKPSLICNQFDVNLKASWGTFWVDNRTFAGALVLIRELWDSIVCRSSSSIIEFTSPISV